MADWLSPVLVGLWALAVACELPTPGSTDGEGDPTAQPIVGEDEGAIATEQPTFTPFTKRPEILNREEVDRAALQVADAFEFEPARNGGEPVPAVLPKRPASYTITVVYDRVCIADRPVS